MPDHCGEHGTWWGAQQIENTPQMSTRSHVQQETQQPPAPSLSNINFQNSAGQRHFSNNNYKSLQYTHFHDLESKVCQIQKQFFFFLPASKGAWYALLIDTYIEFCLSVTSKYIQGTTLTTFPTQNSSKFLALGAPSSPQAQPRAVLSLINMLLQVKKEWRVVSQVLHCDCARKTELYSHLFFLPFPITPLHTTFFSMSQKAQRNVKHEYLKGKYLLDDTSYMAIQSQIYKTCFLWF